MELVSIVRKLWRLRWAVACAVVLAALAALSTVYRLPSLQPKSFEFAAANTQILIDSPKSTLGDLSRDLTPLTARAAVYARFMTSEPIRAELARVSGIEAAKITASSPVDGNGQPQAVEPGSERRASQLADEADRYRLFFQAESSLPVVAVYAEAPTVEGAERIANAAPKALEGYLTSEAQAGIPSAVRVEVSQLGPAHGEMINQGASKIVALLAFVVVLVALCMFILFVSWFRELWVATRSSEGDEELLELLDDFDFEHARAIRSGRD